MGGETDWFILPFTFGAVIGRKLFEQKNVGLKGFVEDGYNELKEWLIVMIRVRSRKCWKKNRRVKVATHPALIYDPNKLL